MGAKLLQVEGLLAALFATLSEGRSRLPAAIVPPPGLGKRVCEQKGCKATKKVAKCQNFTKSHQNETQEAKVEPKT